MAKPLSYVLMASLSVVTLRWGQGKPASLSGTWRFDPEKTRAEAKAQSPDPRTREGYGSGGRPHVGVGMTEPRGGGGQAARNPGEETGGRAGVGPPLNLYARPLPELVIAQSDSGVTISDPSGQPRTWLLNGAKAVEPLLGADSLELQARWKGGRLTTERKLGHFGSVREIYSLDNDANLVVEVRLSAPELSQPLEQRRIYVRSRGSN